MIINGPCLNIPDQRDDHCHDATAMMAKIRKKIIAALIASPIRAKVFFSLFNPMILNIRPGITKRINPGTTNPIKAKIAEENPAIAVQLSDGSPSC